MWLPIFCFNNEPFSFVICYSVFHICDDPSQLDVLLCLCEFLGLEIETDHLIHSGYTIGCVGVYFEWGFFHDCVT